jgi:two-component system sensor histidine kinase DegS
MVRTLRTARDTLRVAISQGRRLIGELRPMILDEQGVVGGIEYLIAEMDSRIKAQLELTSDLKLDYKSPIWGGNLFRIVQEALTNVERHSKATLATVDLTQRGDKLAVEIADNGIGFDIEKVPDDRFGLRSIRERANIFGGSAQIKSTPGQGTKIIVEIPLPRVAPE